MNLPDRLEWLVGELQSLKPASILNVGSKEIDLGFCSPVCVNVDLDAWSLSNFVQADGEHLPFKDHAFDVVVATEVLEHVENPEEFLAECLRVSRRMVIGSTPNELIWGDEHRPQNKFPRTDEEMQHEHMRVVTSERYVVRVCDTHAGRHAHHRFWTEETLRKTLAQVGEGRVYPLSTNPPVFGFKLFLSPLSEKEEVAVCV